MKYIWIVILTITINQLTPNNYLYNGSLPEVEICQKRMTNKEIIYSRLIRHYRQKETYKSYYTKNDIAAIMGNLYAESHYNPQAINPTSKAYGICQWLGSRKKLLFDTYGENPTINQQIDYLIWELEHDSYESKQFNKVKQSKGLINKTRAFCILVERPSKEEVRMSIGKRIREAKTI